MHPVRPPTDLRKLHRDLYRQLLWLVLFVLVACGGTLIALIYDIPTAVYAIGCLIAGAGLILFLWLLLTLIGKLAGED